MAIEQLLVCVVAAGLAACDGGSAAPDSGVVIGPADATPAPDVIDAAPFPDAEVICGEHGGAACFVLPGVEAKAVVAGVEQQANWACAPPALTISSQDIVVAGTVRDLQTQDPVATPTVAAFTASDFSTPVASAVGSAGGTFMIQLPSGMAQSRMSWRVTATGQLPSYTLGADLDITMASIIGQDRVSVAQATADALPAFIGVIRTPGLGLLVGHVVDCDGHDVDEVIATVATTPGVPGALPSFIPEAQVYYFSNGDPDLPVRRNSRTTANKDGQFLIIEIPPTPAGATHFVQVWGFKAAADVALGLAGLSLLSEIETTVFGDAVLVLDATPNQGP